MRILPALFFLALAGCGEAVRDDHFAKDVDGGAPVEGVVKTDAAPVRIGELGANFDACGSVGTTRHLDGGRGEALPVRSAPFESAAETARMAAGTNFFICSRSHDQRWFGVVWADQPEGLSECGVSSPVTSRQDYAGPCRSGWVSSAFVKVIAG